MIKKSIESGEINWNNDSAIVLYDQIADAVNDSFPEYMKESHNVLEEQLKINVMIMLNVISRFRHVIVKMEENVNYYIFINFIRCLDQRKVYAWMSLWR